MKNHFRCILRLLCASAAAGLLMTGCGASYDGGWDSATTAVSSSVSYSKSESFAMENAAADMETADMATGMAATPDVSQQKIIQYLDYEIETLDFSQSVTALESLCSELGGYIQDSYRNGERINGSGLRYASYTLRIPVDQLEAFKKGTDQIGTVASYSTSTENVTEQYYDIETRLKSLRTQEERLLELMEKSETLTDVIELENALSQVTYEIESLTGSLRRYDSLVEYSTVNVALNEVVRYTDQPEVPRTLWDRIRQQFSASLSGLSDFGQDFLVLLVGCSPVLILLALLFCAIFFPVRHVLRKRKKKTPPAASAAPVSRTWAYTGSQTEETGENPPEPKEPQS